MPEPKPDTKNPGDKIKDLPKRRRGRGKIEKPLSEVELDKVDGGNKTEKMPIF